MGRHPAVGVKALEERKRLVRLGAQLVEGAPADEAEARAGIGRGIFLRDDGDLLAFRPVERNGSAEIDLAAVGIHDIGANRVAADGKRDPAVDDIAARLIGLGLADELVVGIDADQRVRSGRGRRRP